MLRPFKLVFQFIGIVLRRLRTQGLRVTILWLYAVGMAWLTGRVPLHYSRISPNLYVGPQFRRWGKKFLQRAGITATVNLRDEFDDEDHGLTFADYSYLPTIDNTAPSMPYLEEGVAFIRRIIEQGGVVYVHCGSGVGRAPTVAAAYLVAHEGLTVEEAVARITAARPFIRILPVQMARLHEYASRVRAEASAPAEAS
jgi:predicted protein tyrosine phosphatase